MRFSSENLTSASAYGTSFFGTIYGFIQKIDWLTFFSISISLFVALTNFYYQRKKMLLELRKIQVEIDLKEAESVAAMQFLQEKRRLELEKLEKNLI